MSEVNLAYEWPFVLNYNIHFKEFLFSYFFLCLIRNKIIRNFAISEFCFLLTNSVSEMNVCFDILI